MTKCRWGTSVAGEPPLPLFASTVNDGRMVNRVGLSRKHIFDAVQSSVKRLGTYIDVLQIHRMDPDVPHEEIMRALNDVVEMGWVRYLGASSVGCHPQQFDRTDYGNRCQLGSFKCFRTLQRNTGGTSLSACKITTTSSIVKRSVR